MSLLSRLFGTSSRISPAEFLERLSPSSTVIDVRTPKEFNQGHLRQATNVNVLDPTFQTQIKALELSEADPVYLYCRTGSRSQKALTVLRKMGFSDVHNVGSMGDLARAGAPIG